MHIVLIRHIVGLLLIFLILGKSGLPVMSFLSGTKFKSVELLLNESEPSSKESESSKEFSLKELFIYSENLFLLAPLFKEEKKIKRTENSDLFSLYHSKVPSPPPDAIKS